MNMRRALVILMLVFDAGCTEPTHFVVPALPSGNRQPAITEQLDAARLKAIATPDNPEALGHYAMALHAYEYFESASLLYAEARRLQPGAFAQAYLHGHTLLALGNTSAAVNAYKTAAKIDSRANTGLGVALLENNEFKAARRAFISALDINPSDTRALYEIGRLEAAAGNLQEAKNYFEQSEKFGAKTAALFYALAELARRMGNSSAADRYSSQFVAAKENNIVWHDPWLAQVSALSLSDRKLMDAATRAVQSGDTDLAIKLNEQAHNLNPDNPLPPAALISLYALAGDNDKSDWALDISNQLDSDSAQLHYNVGLARLIQDRNSDAEKAFIRVTQIDPQGSFAWIKLGSMYIAQGERIKAISALENAYQRAPANDAVRLQLGVMYVDDKKYELAISSLQNVSENESLEAKRLLALGRAYRMTGSDEKARQSLKNAESAALKTGQQYLAAGARNELDLIDAKNDR